jgi:integrase
MADIERLIAQVADPYKPAVWLLAYTWLRPSELCGLRVASVDFVNPGFAVSPLVIGARSAKRPSR